MNVTGAIGGTEQATGIKIMGNKFINSILYMNDIVITSTLDDDLQYR